MGDVWLDLTRTLLRPARPALERCMAERERHLAARKRIGDERTRAIADCEKRIERARAAVFAASDGVVGLTMTDLEREWRKLAKIDPDGGVMDLWARVAPPEWHDRKLWRDGPAMDRVDLAVALASDLEGVEAAERAALRLAKRVAWRFFDLDRAVFVTTFQEPPPRIRDDVSDAVLARFPDRPLFARDVGWLATQRGENVEAVRAIWRAGYGVHTLDGSLIVLELPPL